LKQHRFQLPHRIGQHCPVAGWVVLLLLCSACSIAPSTRLVPEKPIDLSGEWQLDRRVSDDVRARLQPRFNKLETKWRKVEKQAEDRRELFIAEPQAESGPDNSTMHWIREQRDREMKALVAFVSPASHLQIKQSAREIRFTSDKGEGTRVLVPGDKSSLFVAMGGFTVVSGWKDSSFLIDNDGTGDNQIRMLERYTLLADGSELEYQLVARLPEFGKETFRFVYKRKGQ
jgi:hypothetical protein